jgi:ATP-dependent Clp protease protease subunit
MYKEESLDNKNNLIFEKTKDGERVYDIFAKLAKDRGIFIKDEIDVNVGSEICAQLLLLDKQSSVPKPITMYINCYGGDVNSALFTIYDTMRFIKSPVHTVCVGVAYSAAAVLLSAGEPGNRLCFENSDLMIHDVQTSLGHGFSSLSDLNKRAKRSSVLNKRLISILSKNTKLSVEELEKLTKEETWMNAEEALKFGFIDRIIKPSVKEKSTDSETNSVKKKTVKNKS